MLNRMVMKNTGCETLGELIGKRFEGYSVVSVGADMGMDVTHGVEVEEHDNRRYGYGVTAILYPYIEWTDGMWKPSYFCGDYSVMLQKR